MSSAHAIWPWTFSQNDSDTYRVCSTITFINLSEMRLQKELCIKSLCVRPSTYVDPLCIQANLIFSTEKTVLLLNLGIRCQQILH